VFGKLAAEGLVAHQYTPRRLDFFHTNRSFITNVVCGVTHFAFLEDRLLTDVLRILCKYDDLLPLTATRSRASAGRWFTRVPIDRMCVVGIAFTMANTSLRICERCYREFHRRPSNSCKIVPCHTFALQTCRLSLYVPTLAALMRTSMCATVHSSSNVVCSKSIPTTWSSDQRASRSAPHRPSPSPIHTKSAWLFAWHPRAPSFSSSRAARSCSSPRSSLLRRYM